MTTIRTLLTEHINDGLTAEQAVAKILTRKDIKILVRPLLMDEAQNLHRARTRRIEQQVDRDLAGDPPLDLAGRAEARRALVAEQFVLPDGTWVNWLDATADEHRARAGWLRNLAAATLATAARHQQAAAEIESAGVLCLRDLEGVAA